MRKKGSRRGFGERHHKSKIWDTDLVLIEELNAAGLGYKAIGRKMGMSKSGIAGILQGKRRRVRNL